MARCPVRGRGGGGRRQYVVRRVEAAAWWGMLCGLVWALDRAQSWLRSRSVPLGCRWRPVTRDRDIVIEAIAAF